MQIMDGTKIAERKFLEIQKEIERNALSLAIIRILKDPVSETYVNVKKESLEKNGVKVVVYSLQENISEEELKNVIKNIKEDGVIVQLPLPQQIKKENIVNFIDSKRDVDVFTAKLLGEYYLGMSSVIPPVVGAIDILLKEHNIDLEGKNVVLVGSGDLVGKPLAVFFMREGATVSVLNKFTDDISFYTKNADIIVSGTGVPKIITGDIIKEGVVVIDAGTSAFLGGIVGDVDIDSVATRASFLAKVPGGVGPLTIYCLAKNLIELKKTDDKH